MAASITDEMDIRCINSSARRCCCCLPKNTTTRLCVLELCTKCRWSLFPDMLLYNRANHMSRRHTLPAKHKIRAFTAEHKSRTLRVSSSSNRRMWTASDDRWTTTNHHKTMQLITGKTPYYKLFYRRDNLEGGPVVQQCHH